jgi:L-ascorbate peroxidase
MAVLLLYVVTGKSETKYTRDGPGKPGGQSWTVEWLKFDNSYFVEVKTKRYADLLVLPTDAAIFEDEDFR